MAIILPPPSGGPEQLEHQAVISKALRPALTLENGRIAPYPDSQWFEPLVLAADTIAQAARATARLETSDKDLDFIGTAFAVSPTLAVAAGHIARLMLQKSKETSTVYRLNFSSDGSQESASVVVKVKLVHPYFDFALLEMDRPVEEGSILAFSATIPEVREQIALIGYPTYDPRNDAESLTAVFGNVFGTKRVMPGMVIDRSASTGTEVPALIHDASCVSGTSGAPVIQLSTGRVVGVHYAGWFLQKNFAVPAWELARDPFLQLIGLRFHGAEVSPPWLPLWKDKLRFQHVDVEAAGAAEIGARDVPPKKKYDRLLTTEQIIELHGLLVRAGFGSNVEVKALFVGLPVELRAELPDGASETVKLLNSLQDLNQRTELLDGENHSSLYIAISSAKALKLTDDRLCTRLQQYLSILQAKEDALTRAQGVASIATPSSANFRYVATVIAKTGGKTMEFDGWSKNELKTTIGKIQMTFPNTIAGLEMLRGFAVRNSIRPFTIQEKSDKFVLRAEERPS
jgi:hypothetical protein